MATKMQLALKSLLDQGEAILKEAGENPLSQEQMKTYNDLLAQAERVRAQIDAEDKAAALRKWASEPDGNSAVKAGFVRNAMPEEGTEPGVTADARSGELYALNSLGEEKVKTLKSGAYKDAFNQYIRSMGRFGDTRAIKGDAMKVLNEGSDTAGGFWVPPDYRAELIKKIATMAAVRPNAYAFTTGSDIATFPKVTYTTDDKYTSGVRFGWQESSPLSADISEATNPIAGREVIPVHTATAALIVTREMLEDAQFDILGYLTMLFSEAYALGEEDAFINGTGVGQPQGFLNHPLATTAHSGGGMKVLSGYSAAIGWGTLTSGSSTGSTTGILGIEASLPPQYEANAKWLANKATWSAARAMTDSQGRPLWNLIDQWPSMVNGMASTLLGYPVLKSQFMPDISATTYPIWFGDLGGYYIADRVGLSIEVLRELRALRGEVVLYARKRLGGQIVHYWRGKLLKSNGS